MTCTIHSEHTHRHGSDCGHKTIKHDGHEDFLHDGHLHFVHGDHVDEHVLDVSSHNADTCTPHNCGGHDEAHSHGPNCGHHAIPHGQHIDYVVAGHLHHPCDSHCDHHGPVSLHETI